MLMCFVKQSKIVGNLEGNIRPTVNVTRKVCYTEYDTIFRRGGHFLKIG